MEKILILQFLNSLWALPPAWGKKRRPKVRRVNGTDLLVLCPKSLYIWVDYTGRSNDGIAGV